MENAMDESVVHRESAKLWRDEAKRLLSENGRLIAQNERLLDKNRWLREKLDRREAGGIAMQPFVAVLQEGD
jgi:hypothetical protein